MTQRVLSYAVMGTAAHVWPIAAMLTRQLGDAARITVVEEAGDAVSAAAIPLADPVFALLDLGVNELAEMGANFALGWALEGFGGEGSRTVLAQSGDLPAIGGLALHHVMHRVAEAAGAMDRFAELSEGFRFCARAAAQGRMALAQDAPDTPLAMLGPLVILDRPKFASGLAKLVPAECITTVRGPIESLEYGADQTVQAAIAADGMRIEADVFIDARQAQCEGETMCFPILQATQIEADVTASPIPVFAARPSAAEQQQSRCALSLPWKGNWVKMGPASASLGPMFSADARLFLLQLSHLAQCLPAGAGMTAEARRYNRLHRQSAERLYEFSAAPLHLSGRTDAQWQGVRQIEPPEGLALRIDQFRSRGHLPELDGEIADRQLWIDMLVAHGIVPQRRDRRADRLDPRKLDRALGTVRAQLDQALAAMPDQRAFLERVCPK